MIGTLHRHPAERWMSPREWDAVCRLLVIRLDNIGDVILLGPAIRALRQRIPNVELTLLASPAGASVARFVPGIDHFIAHSAVWQDAGSQALSPEDDSTRTLALAQRLRDERFDAAVIFTSFSQSPYPPAQVCYEAEIPRRIGQSKEFGAGSSLTGSRRRPTRFTRSTETFRCSRRPESHLTARSWRSRSPERHASTSTRSRGPRSRTR